jgi:hypothetical protein
MRGCVHRVAAVGGLRSDRPLHRPNDRIYRSADSEARAPNVRDVIEVTGRARIACVSDRPRRNRRSARRERRQPGSDRPFAQRVRLAGSSRCGRRGDKFNAKQGVQLVEEDAWVIAGAAADEVVAHGLVFIEAARIILLGTPS